jgi:hypothetical protein
MSHDWLNLLFTGQLIHERLQDCDADFELAQAMEWQQQLISFLSHHSLTEPQKQALLLLIEQLVHAAEARGVALTHLQEDLIKTHQVSRKYLQSS